MTYTPAIMLHALRRRARGILGPLALALLSAGCGNGAGDTVPLCTPASPCGLPAGSLVHQGQTLVAMRACAGCHQSMNPRDGELSGQTTPQPGTMAYGPNLTPEMATGIGNWSDANITRAIRLGLDDSGRVLCTTMPRHTGMTDAEAHAVVAYLRSLAPVHRTIPDSRCGP